MAPPGGFFILFLILAADLKPVLVFLFRCHPAPDVAFRFVDVQHHPGAGGQRRIDMFQAVGDVFMHCTLADPKFLCRLPDCGVAVYNVVGNGNRPLFDIFFHGKPPEILFLHPIHSRGILYIRCRFMILCRNCGGRSSRISIQAFPLAHGPIFQITDGSARS